MEDDARRAEKAQADALEKKRLADEVLQRQHSQIRRQDQKFRQQEEAAKLKQDEEDRIRQELEDKRQKALQGQLDALSPVKSADRLQIWKKEGSVQSLVIGNEPELSITEDIGEFHAVLVDEDISAEERDALRVLQLQRIREEAKRKKELKEQFERERIDEQRRQMLEFKKITEQKQQEHEQREKDMQVSKHTYLLVMKLNFIDRNCRDRESPRWPEFQF